jgi:phage terminase large subunit-like protein
MYNNPKFWNASLREDFLQKRLNLWDKSYYGYNREEAAENRKKWRESARESIDQEALPKK